MNVGNLFLQKKLGVLPVVPPLDCDASMSNVALGAGFQDDLCAYESIADLAADPRYPGVAGFESNFELITSGAWNGKQSLRILGQVGGYSLFLPTIDTSVLKNVWLRTVFRLEPGGLGPNGSELGKWVYDFGGGFYLDFQADGSTSAPRYVGSPAAANWEPGLIQYDDGSWWEMCLHFDTTNLATALMAVYMQHADHTGTQYSEAVNSDGSGWMEGNLDFNFSAPSEPAPYPWLDVGAWEFSDGAVNADPFGVLP